MFYAKSRVIAYVVLSAMFFSSMVLPSSANGSFTNTFRANFKGTVETANGLNTATFETPEGKIRVLLPDDIRPTDRISGKVAAFPKGIAETEKQQNSSVLRSYIVQVEKALTPVSGELISLNVPEKVNNNMLDLTLRTPEGKELAKLQVPTNPTPEENFLRDYQLPSIGQDGRPITITGNFDGDLTNTRCALGNESATVLAESPRKTVFDSPESVIGPTELSLKEGNADKKEPFRNVAIGLAVPKLNLTKGEQTTLTVNVQGLQKLENPVSVQLIGSGTIEMSGGNTQTMLITPEKVLPNGGFITTRTLTALQAGYFSVNANLIPVSLGSASCSLSGQTVAVETSPDGEKGIWKIRIKTQNGETGLVYFRSEKKPELKSGNWIKIKKCRADDKGEIYVEEYELTQAPAR